MIKKTLLFVICLFAISQGFAQTTARDKGYFVVKSKTDQAYLRVIENLKSGKSNDMVNEIQEDSHVGKKMNSVKDIDSDQYNYYQDFFQFYNGLSSKIKESLTIDQILFIYAFDEENYHFILIFN